MQYSSEEMQKNKDKFFNLVIKKLPSRDWNEAFIENIEQECVFPKGYSYILFKTEMSAKIVIAFEKWLDDQMLSHLEQQDKPEKIREQIAYAVLMRITELIPKEILIKNAEFFTKPCNIIFAMEAPCSSTDAIWRYAGDESNDFNYYTKRGLLLPVYIAAKAHYLADSSDDNRDLKKFIKKALDNIVNIASLKQNIKTPNIEDIPILRLFS